MNLFKYIKDLDRKFAWSFLGVVLALIFGGVTVYREFFEDMRPALRYDILTSTSVLDVREELSNLSVLFDGVDIRKQGLSLRMITVRVLNFSSKDILKGHYDDMAPLGLYVSTGRVIRTELVDASNNYLRNNLDLGIKDDQTLLFNSVIIEAGESFTLKLLVLHPEEHVPILSQVGKVAGIQNVPIREAFRDASKEPFLTRTFKGGIFVQIVRILAYTFGIILLLVAIIVPIAITSSKLNERKRKKIVKDFKGITEVDLNESDEFIFTHYVQKGAESLMSMNSLVSEEESLAVAYTRYREHRKRNKDANGRPIMDRYEHDAVMGDWFYCRRIENYLHAGLIQKTDEGLKVDKHLYTTIEHFVRFLKNKGLLQSKENGFSKPNREHAREEEPETEEDKQEDLSDKQ